ncbi:MAG: DUF1638 domain-containing protein [Ignavibacteriaceae bacterium]|nr:DUF1638 domain-containing protein [Ignavibacteriaceae bacterium]
MKKNNLNIELNYVSSMLHMYPEKLEISLNKKLEKIKEDEKTLLLFGDCHPHMHEMEIENQIVRMPGINCIEMLLEKKEYRKLRKEGAFFLLPEWTHRWREVFMEELGLSEEVAKGFFKDCHTKLVYIDTKVNEIPLQIINDISEFTGLPYEILEIDYEVISDRIKDLIKNFSKNTEEKKGE